jgi:hypothetical protein
MNSRKDLEEIVGAWIRLHDKSVHTSAQSPVHKPVQPPFEVLRAIFMIAYDSCERTHSRVKTWYWRRADGYECGDPKLDESEWQLTIAVDKYKIIIAYSEPSPEDCHISVSSGETVVIDKLYAYLVDLCDFSQCGNIIMQLTKC